MADLFYLMFLFLLLPEYKMHPVLYVMNGGRLETGKSDVTRDSSIEELLVFTVSSSALKMYYQEKKNQKSELPVLHNNETQLI